MNIIWYLKFIICDFNCIVCDDYSFLWKNIAVYHIFLTVFIYIYITKRLTT